MSRWYDAIPAMTESDGKWENRPTRDWTSFLPDTEHVRFFKSVDWSKTKVGPIADWSCALRQATYQVMADSRPATLYWGPEYVPIYNAAFTPLAGATHPTLMGSTFQKGFPELWEGISPLFALGINTGFAADVIEAPMIVERNGYAEETFFTGNFTPIRDSDGHICGFYNALFEVTRQIINDRRTTLLNRIGALTVPTSDNVDEHIIECLSSNPNDITMAMLYKLDGEDEKRKVLRLQGHIGLPEKHTLLVDVEDWGSPDGLIPYCRLARSQPGGIPLTVTVDDKFDGITWRGPGGPSKTVAIIPLINGLQLFGFLIIGTNPRLLDEANSQFLRDVGRTVSSVMATAVSMTQSRLRQERLERDLANSAIKIQHLVQHASVSMVHLLLDRTIIWANNQYYSIIGQVPIEGQDDYSFFDIVLEADQSIAEEAWQKVVHGDEHVSAEIRLNRLYTPPLGDPVPATFLLLAFPYREDGTVLSVMACVTDISRLKWAENWQAMLAKTAQEEKRQQELFIDIVSHEMRNPLSAIMHSVESIVAAIDECRVFGELPKYCEDALTEITSAARIIETCAKHQRYIIDSILTIGRIESSMLSFNPSHVEIGEFCRSMTAIFENEARHNDISIKISAHGSYSRLGVQDVLTDPSRLAQVFINLFTNAIKFVKACSERQITVKYGACISSPRALFPSDVHWAPKGDKPGDVTESAQWGPGEQLYMTFSIKDSGIGISQAQMSSIFERFKQANIKTHVVYGGSGLGLYISKQLTEKQGGEIGVQSTVGEGSLFVFYIRVRRIEKAPDNISQQQLPLLPKPSTIKILPVPASSGSPNVEGGQESRKAEKKIHVLLVEDNIVNQQVLRKQLTRAGYLVYTANHGRDALTQLESMNCYSNQISNDKPVDIILMDIQMPVMNGLECTREIRRLESEGAICRHMPIIAVTANARKEQIDEALAAGSDTCMSKPFKSADLIALIQEELRKQEHINSHPSETPGVAD